MKRPDKLPERNDGRYTIQLDHTEVSAYRHNPRCYFWEHYLGLRPPLVTGDAIESAGLLEFGQAFHTFAEHFYGSNRDYDNAWNAVLERHADNLQHYGDLGNFRTLGRLELLIEKYLEDAQIKERDNAWTVINTEDYIAKPIGANIAYGGRLDLTVLDERDDTVWIVDHKTSKRKVDSDYYMRWHSISYQMVGYTWLGEYKTNLMREAGSLPLSARFGGVIINALQCSPKIEYNQASCQLTFTEFQIQEFVRNAFLVGTEIMGRRRHTAELYENYEPIENAWPYWPTYSESWCDWAEINSAPSETVQNELLAQCTFDPWWLRRTKEDL